MSESDIQTVLLDVFPLYKHIGLVVESARDGTYRCRVPFDARNGNHLHTVHAAIQWAAGEVLGGVVVIAVFGPERFAHLYGAVRSASIEFLRPARTDITAEAFLGSEEGDRMKTLVAAGEEARFGLHSVVRSTSGEVVAKMSAEYIVRPRRTGQKVDEAGAARQERTTRA